MPAARSWKGRAVFVLGLTLACLNLADSRPTTTNSQPDVTPSPSPTTITTAFASSPSPSPSASPSPTPSTSALSPRPVPTQPSAVFGMAYGSSGDQLFVQGGRGASGLSFQYFSLNLGQNWSASAAVWKNLEVPSGNTASPAPGPPAGLMAAEVEAIPFTMSGSTGAITENQFLVVGEEKGSPPRLFAFNSTQWNPISFEDGNNGQFSSTGPLAVTDPNTGIIYFLGDGLKYTPQSLPPQSQPAQLSSIPTTVRLTSGSAASWSSVRNGILATIPNDGLGMDVQFYNPDTPLSGWVSLNTSSMTVTMIASRTGHCFVPNSNGSNYYLFGGLKNDGITYLSDLYELDIAKNTWTKLKDAPSDGRDQMACTVSGMTLIVWGGRISGGFADALPLIYDAGVADWTTSFVPVQSSIVPPRPTAIPNSAPSKNSDTGAIIGGAAAAVVVCAIAAALFVIRQRRQKRRGSLPKNGGSFADYSHAKMSRGSLDKNEQVPSQDSTAGLNRYTYIASPFADDAQDQVQINAMSPGMSSPSHRYSDQPVSVHTRSISGYSIPPTAASQYDNSQLSSALSYTSYPQAEEPVQSQRFSQLPPPIPPPQTRPEVQSVILTSERQELPPEAWFDDEPRMTSRAHRDDRDYDDDQSSILSVPRSAGAPSAVELIPIEASTAESEGFLTRSNTVASSAAGGKKSGKGGTNGLQPPQEKDEEGSRRDSTESLDYLDVA